MFDPAFSHPAFIRNEPVRAWSFPHQVAILLRRCLQLVVTFVLSLPFWPMYLVLRLFWRRPPIVPSNARYARGLRMVLFDRDPHGPTFLMRISLFLELIRRACSDGVWGLAWLWDEVVWGRKLRQVQIVEPIFEISAARSGSTQLARYLEDDPRISSPNTLQVTIPYLWSWRFGPWLERLLPKDFLEKLSHDVLPPEHHERHEVDLRRTDTFEMMYWATFHWGELLLSASPKAFMEEFCLDRVHDDCPELWADDFLRFIDAIGRKTLLHAGPDAQGKLPQLLIKGHFLHALPELARRYPDARFLTMIRVPEKRLQSLLNFLRCQGTVAPCPPFPWAWITEYLCTREIDYCETEMEWFERPDGPNRCVVRFDEYVKDLPGTIERVYREGLGREPPANMPREHAARTRSNYSVDRSFAEAGIDEAAMKERLDAYRKWCKARR